MSRRPALAARPLITGAARGIGRAFVDEFLEAGAERVYAGVRKAADADRLAAADPRITPLLLDATNPAQVRAAAAAAADLTVLVNNAGVQNRGAYLGYPDLAPVREEMEVNYFGPLAMVRAFAPALAENRGAVVNVLSIAALAYVPSAGPYNASKMAAQALTLCLREELAGRVRVIGVYPAGYDTAMAAHVDKAFLFPPRQLTAAVLSALRDGGPDEVLPDATSQRIAAALRSGWPAADAVAERRGRPGEG